MNSNTETILILTCFYSESEHQHTSVHKTEETAFAHCLQTIEEWLDGKTVSFRYPNADIVQLRTLFNDRDLWGFIKEWNSISGGCKFECEKDVIYSNVEIPNIFE